MFDSTKHDPQVCVGLQCLIVGGSIAGLAAGLALRAQGHHVKIYDQDELKDRWGAGLAIFPNAKRALDHLDIKIGSIRPATVEKMIHSTVDLSGKFKSETKIMDQQWDWMNVVYPDILNALHDAILDENRPGPKAEIHIGKIVGSVDPVHAVMYFTDGTEAQGDLIVGADGVHSICRSILNGSQARQFRLDRVAFRGTVPYDEVVADPLTRELVESSGLVHHHFIGGKAFYLHPASDGKTIAVRFTYRDPKLSKDGKCHDWRDRPNKAKLMEIAQDLPPVYQRLLEKIRTDSLQHVPVWDMDPLSTWNSYRLVVIGDAAHTMPPYWGQRTAMALEDAIALGILLEKGSTTGCIEERLSLFGRMRKERVTAVQECVRELGELVSWWSQSHFDASFFHKTYILDYDEHENITTVFQAWKTQNPTAMTVVRTITLDSCSGCDPAPPNLSRKQSWRKFLVVSDRSVKKKKSDVRLDDDTGSRKGIAWFGSAKRAVTVQ